MKIEKAIFGAGCFWCTEAVFDRLNGIKSVVPGYSGGTKPNPTYEEVCSGTTGHAEVAQISFDRALISFDDLLTLFWESHDPTTLNRQGADQGTQYRSAIFYVDERQKELAEKSKVDAQRKFVDRIVTEIVPFTKFYEAEDYHRKYYINNPNAPYCRLVIKPKLDKLSQNDSRSR
jgi:peptide-methionine (S)-S-oxide reductase